MHNKKHVKIVIGVDGKCSVDAVNFAGPTCKSATQEIMQALGGNVEKQHDKPEIRIRQRCGQGEREQTR